ncbi:restriction endonuclease [Chloroflexota bacterium]
MDLDVISEATALTRIESGKLIYAPAKPTLIVPKLIIPAQSYLVSLVKDHPESLFDITPRQFEELIAELFHDFGFDIELTQATRDGDRDIVAIYEAANIKTKYLIECKRYKSTTKVSLAIVQRLYGVKMSEAANKAILVTTSSFSKPANQFASSHVWDLDLKGYDDIIQWVDDYNSTRKPFI